VDKPSTTLTRNFGTPSSARCIHPKCDRALTTREGARLQSFNDNFQFYGSKQKKNLQIGNAVPPLLAEALAKQVEIALK
jgi:DNA (cytosine-5)-methyltransferase 1